jgi:hypothetical protein
MFRGIAKCNIGDGSTMLFWSNLWNGNILESKFPRLYSFARNKNISVAIFLSNNMFEAQFHLPLSEQAFQEFQSLQVLIEALQGILGNTFGEARITPPRSATTFPTRTYNL